jgi:hypothetical protein
MSVHHHTDDLPLNTPQGAAPNGTVAYSNHEVEKFAGVRNHDGEFFTGYQWQCVEFARRWLWNQKGLMLPDIDIAAEIFFVPHMYDPIRHREAPVRPVRNGGAEKPLANTYLIYAPAPDNFPGHIAVITEVGDDYVLVCDQNRDFRKWSAGNYAIRYPLEHTNGRWTIIDKEDPIIGWVDFPDSPDLPLPMGDVPDTWVDDKGHMHAKMRRPLPADFAAVPDYSRKARRHTFWRAMMEFRPHWVVMPFMLARIVAMMFTHVAYYAIRTKVHSWMGRPSSNVKAD